eukprot:6199004-Pleurochrysis_carterae.AAC.2
MPSWRLRRPWDWTGKRRSAVKRGRSAGQKSSPRALFCDTSTSVGLGEAERRGLGRADAFWRLGRATSGVFITLPPQTPYPAPHTSKAETNAARSRVKPKPPRSRPTLPTYEIK